MWTRPLHFLYHVQRIRNQRTCGPCELRGKAEDWGSREMLAHGGSRARPQGATRKCRRARHHLFAWEDDVPRAEFSTPSGDHPPPQSPTPAPRGKSGLRRNPRIR